MFISMGFEADYIKRAFKIYVKNYGHSYNVEVITEIIVRLQNKDKSKLNGHRSKSKFHSKPPTSSNTVSNQKQPIERDNSSSNSMIAPFVSHMTLQDALKLKVYDKLDHRDNAGHYLLATVSGKRGTNLKIHYYGLTRKLDTWSDFSDELHRFAPAESISRRPAHRFQHLGPGDYVDINPRRKHPGWKEALIHSVDEKSGQIQVCYEGMERNWLYWTHLDDTEEIAEFSSRSGPIHRRHFNVSSVANQSFNTDSNQKQSRDNDYISQSSNSKIPPFVPHMTLQDASKLQIHDKIDHRDPVGRFLFATVLEKQGTNLKIHYHGWSHKWDGWSDFSKEIHRFAAPGSISKRPAHRFQHLKRGSYIDINPTQCHPGWKCGEIRRWDKNSGQVQVCYGSMDKNYLYWAHLDDTAEIAEFTSQSETVHQTQSDVLNNSDIGRHKQQQNMGSIKSSQRGHMSGSKEMAGDQSMGGGHGARRGDVKARKDHNVHHSGSGVGAAPIDEIEAFQRIRAKRFPRRKPNERIANKYRIGDCLKVLVTQTLQWNTATVIDREDNWIVVHFNGWPSKYDQKIHVVNNAQRLRDTHSELPLPDDDDGNNNSNQAKPQQHALPSLPPKTHSNTESKSDLCTALMDTFSTLKSAVSALSNSDLQRMQGNGAIFQFQRYQKKLLRILKKATSNNQSINSRKRRRSELEDDGQSQKDDVEPRMKRRKIQQRSPDLSSLISPAPIHWKIQNVEEDEVKFSKNGNRGQLGRFRIKLKIQKHPIKEALFQIGARNFTVNELMDILLMRDFGEKTESMRLRIEEELMVISGVYRISKAIKERKALFCAAAFYNNYTSSLYDSYDAVYSALRTTRGAGKRESSVS